MISIHEVKFSDLKVGDKVLASDRFHIKDFFYHVEDLNKSKEDFRLSYWNGRKDYAEGRYTLESCKSFIKGIEHIRVNWKKRITGD